MINHKKASFALLLCLGISIRASSWAATSQVGADERAFFTGGERPAIKPRQKLGIWFVSAESLLWRSALEALSDKSADKLTTADDCEMAMWAAARNEGLRQSLDRAFLPLIDTLMTGGLSPALSAFSVPGKIVIAETLAFAVRLFNQSTFGVLETKNIPIEVVRTLLNITAGYTAPLLADDYLAGKITETALRTSLNPMIDKEELVVSRAEASNLTSRNFSPKQGLPLVKVNVILVYSPYTHFVTLFIRGVGEGCPGNRLFLLQYEVDKDGLLVKNTLKERPVINLESLSPQLTGTNRKPALSSATPTTAGGQWRWLKPGEEQIGFKLGADGTLSYQGKTLMPKLLVHDDQGKSYYAPPRSRISPSSPSGRYNFIMACEREEDSPLCWFFYLVDIKKRQIATTFAGKYGPREWIKWSPDETFAILAYSDEGSTRLYRIDLNTGNSDEISMWNLAKSQGHWICPTVYLRVDLGTFAWINDHTFYTQVNIWCANNWGDQDKLARVEKVEVDVTSARYRLVNSGAGKR
jgi:hypothetical protein